MFLEGSALRKTLESAVSRSSGLVPGGKGFGPLVCSAASSTNCLQALHASLIAQAEAVVPSLPPPTGVNGALLSY